MSNTLFAASLLAFEIIKQKRAYALEFFRYNSYMLACFATHNALTSALNGGERSDSRPRDFIPGERAPDTLRQEVGWALDPAKRLSFY
jgi:hypothetical protein